MLKSEKSPAAKSIVIAKFYTNPNVRSKNKLLTKTLAKLGVIDRDWLQAMKYSGGAVPQNSEMWKCKITKEIQPGKEKGCFILQPMHKVDYDQIVKLIPGLYTEEKHEGLLIIRPTIAKNYILPLDQRKKINSKNIYAIVVDLRTTKERQDYKDLTIKGPYG